MFSFSQRLLRLFGTKVTPQKTANIPTVKTVDKKVSHYSSIPDVTVSSDIIDTSSLFYDLLFGAVDVDNVVGLNPLEKDILISAYSA